VIIGIRPEHFEDAALIGDDKRSHGATVTAKVDLLESLGSDKFAYFTVQGQRATAAHLQELAADAGTEDIGAGEGEGVQVTARLDAASKAAEDQELEFWIDLEKVHVFDPESGENLTLAEGARGSEAATTVQAAVPAAAEASPSQDV
jgi:multiple sugar transport system ATP-binding protein